MDKWLDLIRGAVRPALAIIYGLAGAALAVVAFIKFGNSDMAQTLVGGFIGWVGGIMSAYFIMRSAEKK